MYGLMRFRHTNHFVTVRKQTSLGSTNTAKIVQTSPLKTHPNPVASINESEVISISIKTEGLKFLCLTF